MRSWVAKLLGAVRSCWPWDSSRSRLSAVGCTGTASRCVASRRRAHELTPLAAKQIPQVFGYDYQTVERSLNEVYPLLTPDYRQEFEDRANKDIIPQARERQLVSQANVVGVGVLSAQRNSALGDGVHEPHGDRQVQDAGL